MFIRKLLHVILSEAKNLCGPSNYEILRRPASAGLLRMTPIKAVSGWALVNRLNQLNLLFRIFHCPGFPDDSHFNLSGVTQVSLNLFGDVPAQHHRLFIGNLVVLDYNT